MALPESTKESKKRYKLKRELLAVEIPKGKKAAYRQVADALGLSMARLIQQSVEEYARKYANEVPEFPQTAEEFLTERENLLLKRFNRLEPKTQMAFIHLMDDFIEPLGTQDEETTIQLGVEEYEGEAQS